jgi:hypothetical protein
MIGARALRARLRPPDAHPQITEQTAALLTNRTCLVIREIETGDLCPAGIRAGLFIVVA